MTPSSPQPRIVLVTGASRGIGLACAEAFAEIGATVIRTDITDTDLTQRPQVDALFARIAREHGRLDTLIANAGAPSANTTLATTDDEFQHSLDVNLRSVWWCARAAHPLLLQGTTPSIVTITSAQGLRANKRSFPYSAAKGGLIALTRSLAVEFAPHIRANAIIPGQIESVRTAAYFNSFRDPAEARRRVLQTFPLGRLGTPQDIARAARFLASEDAAFITGTLLHVDGGRDAALPDFSDLQ
jgi:NAD(P)-dependent dehydrogenase (short-subunit alcohol dehydrogenase family)